MDHQIVKSQDLLTLENLISNQLSQSGSVGFPNRGSDGVPGSPTPDQIMKSATKSPHSRPMVQPVRPHHRCQEHCAGRDHIVPAVCRRGLQGCRVDAPAQGAVKRGPSTASPKWTSAEPQPPPAKIPQGREGIFFSQSFGQLHDDQNQSRYRQTGDILPPERDHRGCLISRFFSDSEAHQSHHRTGGVRQVVHGVGCNGYGTGQGPDYQLSCK